MQKTLFALCAVSSVEAYRSSDHHPFMGENAEKSVIMHPEGGSTHRAIGVADTMDKYQDLISTRKYRTYKSGYRAAYEVMFGKSAETLAFEREVEAIHARKHSRQHRLRSKQTFEADSDLFLGSFYM